MAEVTGFTAARMLAMEDATIIDAELGGSSGYELILKTKDGTEVNVGDVRGATGPVGPAVTALDDIGNVNAPAPANGDKLGFDLASGEWVAAPRDYVSLEEYNELDDNPIIINRLNNPDASLAEGTGILQLGPSGALNMVLDNNEIMARDGFGGPRKMFLQTEGGDLQIGGPSVDVNAELLVELISNGSLTLDLRADEDNVDETHTPTLRLSQDGGSVWAEFLIDANNDVRLKTSDQKYGGPYMQWIPYPNVLNSSGIPGINLTNQACYRCGNFGYIIFVAQVSKSITGGSTGDTGNETILNTGSSFQGSGPNGQALGTSSSGSIVATSFNPSNGTINLTALMPNVDLNGRTISGSGFVLVDF